MGSEMCIRDRHDRFGYRYKIKALNFLHTVNVAFSVGLEAGYYYPNCAGILIVRARTQWKLGIFGRAETFIRRANQLEPYNPDVLIYSNDLYVETWQIVELQVLKKKQAEIKQWIKQYALEHEELVKRVAASGRDLKIVKNCNTDCLRSILLEGNGYYLLMNSNQSNYIINKTDQIDNCLLYTSPSPRDLSTSRMPSSA